MTPSKTVLILPMGKNKARNAVRALVNIRLQSPVEGRRHVMLRHNFLGVVSQCFRLRQEFQTLDDLWIGLCPDFHAFILAKSVDKNL